MKTNIKATEIMYKKLSKIVLMFYNSYYFFYFFGVGSFLPLYAIYLKKEFDLSNGDIGIILSIFPLVSIIFQPIFGIITDRFNASTKIIKLSLVMIGISEVLIFTFPVFSEYINLDRKVLLIVFTILFSIFNSTISPIQDGLSVLFTRKYNYKFGNIRVFGSIGWAVATFLSALFVTLFGYQVIAILSSISYIIAILLFIKLKKVKVKKKPSTLSKYGNISSVFKNKVFVTFLLFSGLSFGVIAPMGTFYILRLEELGAPTEFIGSMNTLVVVLEIITMFILLSIKSLYKDFNLLIISILIQLPGLVLLIFVDNIYILILVAILRGIYQGMFIPIVISYISSILLPDEIGIGVMIYSALSMGLVSWSITLLGGYISEWYSLPHLFTFALSLVVLSLIIGIILSHIKIRREIDQSIKA